MSQSIKYPIVRLLVEPGTNLVRFETLQETHNFLLRSNFQLVDKEQYGLGYHLFYIKEDILIRIKTHGDPNGPRQNQAHLSVANWAGSLEYEDEFGKYDRDGFLKGKPDKKKDMKAFSVWAGATHFNFKSKHLAGAERLSVKHANA